MTIVLLLISSRMRITHTASVMFSQFLAHLISLSDVLLLSKVRNFNIGSGFSRERIPLFCHWLWQICLSNQIRERILSGADSLGSSFRSRFLSLSANQMLRNPLPNPLPRESAPERIRSWENLLLRESAPICHVTCLNQSEAQKSPPESALSGVDSLGSRFSQEQILLGADSGGNSLI